MTTSGRSGDRVLVLYPPGIGYYEDREFLALLPGFATTYSFPDPQIAARFRTPPAAVVSPAYEPAVRGMPGSTVVNSVVRDLPSLLDAVRPRYVVTYECFSALSAQVARSPRRATFRHVVLSYETVAPLRSLWGWFPVTRWYARLTCRSADLLVAHSARASRALQAAGADPARVLHRSPGVYPVPAPPGSDAPSDHPEGLQITYLGSLTRNKGASTVAEAALLLEDSPDGERAFHFSIIGEGPLRSEMERRTATIRSKFQFHGRVDESRKHEILAGSTLLVYPSRDIHFGPLIRWEEQTATAAMEAMALGVPVLGSDSGALPEIVGEAGQIFPQGSPRGLADGIRSMCHSSSELAGLRDRARARATSEFDIQRCANDIAERMHAVDLR